MATGCDPAQPIRLWLSDPSKLCSFQLDAILPSGAAAEVEREVYFLLRSLFHIQWVANHWPSGCLRSTPKNLPESLIGSSRFFKV